MPKTIVYATMVKLKNDMKFQVNATSAQKEVLKIKLEKKVRF